MEKTEKQRDQSSQKVLNAIFTNRLFLYAIILLICFFGLWGVFFR